MIEHYLNGTQVFPAAGEKIQITSENAILTKSGSYTLEVKFPLSIFENRTFFGDLNRTDITKNVTTWDVEIKNNNTTLIIGTATLVKATETEVSLQYVAGNSQVNFWENADKTYIDEYDYNTMEDGRDRVEAWADEYTGFGVKRNLGFGFSASGQKSRQTKFWGIGFFREYDVPISQKDAKFFFGEEGVFAFANVYDEDYEWDDAEPSHNRNGIEEGNGVKFGRIGAYGSRIYYGYALFANCIQPNLLWVIEQVVEKRGYKIERNDIKDWGKISHRNFYGYEIIDGYYTRMIYIASARLTLKIADALPHWTIKEFFEQVEKFFNCTLVFNEEKRTCSFVMNNKVLEGEKFKIEDIVDEHEESISSEVQSEVNIFGSNIKYKDIGKEDAIRCDDATRKKYPTVWGESWGELRDKAMRISKAEWKFYKDKSRNGYTYGWDGSELQAIDHLCSLYRGSEEDLELKIVPARIAEKFYNTGEFLDKPNEGRKYAIIRMSVLTMKNGWKGYIKSTGNIVQEVNGQVQGVGEGNKEDFLPVFFYERHNMNTNNGRANLTICYSNSTANAEITRGISGELFGHSVPVADIYTGKDWKHCLVRENERRDISMALVPGHTPIYQGQMFDGNPKINMEDELQLKFLSISPPNPRAIFIIHNKRYLCSKIEYEIDEKGIDTLMTGYFHEVVEG